MSEPARPPHQIRKTWVAIRKGECARCGLVNIKSGGSNRRGGVRWRCANQVNEYRRRKAATDRRAAGHPQASDYGFTLIWPCCNVPVEMEPPTTISEVGDANDEYNDKCPSCGLARIIRVAWYADDEGTLDIVVSFVDVEQVYSNGELVDTRTAAALLDSR